LKIKVPSEFLGTFRLTDEVKFVQISSAWRAYRVELYLWCKRKIYASIFSEEDE